MFIDYHVHTEHSLDSKTSMEVMCSRAIKLGLSEIAFTDHLDSHPLDIDVGYYDPDLFFEDIEHCRSLYPRLTIRAGIEVGEPHQWHARVHPVINGYPYDLVLGSLHRVGSSSIFDRNYFRSRRPQQAYGGYFTELISMIRHGGFDILAHADVVKRVGYEVYSGFNSSAYEDAIREVWQACIDNEIAIEINTKGIANAQTFEMHPSALALGWYADMGGTRLTFGSDAHRPEALAGYFDRARRCALEAGLTRICRFEQRKMVGWIDL